MLVAVCFVLTLFAGRLVQLQGVDAASYVADATQTTHTTILAQRGTITDAAGHPLATTVEARNVTADQTLVTDPAGEAKVLAPMLHLDVADVTKRLSGTRRFVYVAKQITPDLWHQIDDADLPGIFSERTTKRVYPGGTLAANILGFVRTRDDAGSGSDYTGGGGLEYQLQDVLAGKNGMITSDSAGASALAPGSSTTVPPVPGTDVHLTINSDIQWMAQQAIAAKVKETKSESGTVIVMKPDGTILAMATAPTFDPNNLTTLKGQPVNRALQEAYEPGSTGKLITAAALLDQGVVDLDTKLTVPNRLPRAGKSFKDWENHAKPEKLTYAGTIARSSNIGTILAAERLGDLSKIYPYFQKFGIGQPLGLGFPGATSGSVLPPSKWSATTPYTMVFGQGYSVNTVQMASVVATIANGGLRVAPSLIAGYTRPDGAEVAPPAPKQTRVVPASVAKKIGLMMESVVMKGGTAPSAQIPGYRVAGKTGTAYRYNATCNCYKGYTMSFIGFAPADAPKLVVAVTLQDPKNGSGGGSTGGPVFHDVMAFALQTLKIPPTGAPEPVVKITWD